MFDKLTLRKNVRDLASELKKDHKLSDFESLSLALQAERNEILSRAFVLSDSDQYPTALETIVHKLEDIKVSISDLSNELTRL